VTALVVAPGPDEALHLLAGVMGGVFISSDGGASWSPTALSTPAPFLTALALSPDYASDGIAFAASIEDGVFRTNDYGANWRAWPFGLFDLNVLGLAVSPDFAADGMVYALTESGIYRSHNQGRAWKLIDFPAEAVPALCLAFSSGWLYAGSETAGLYRSADRGDSWQRVDSLAIDDSINAILPGANDLLVLSSDSAWVSADAGRSWAQRYADLDFGDGLTCAHAPQGLDAGKPLLLGLADGRILIVPT
jgi:photosystem II stability/assembly factor-like uncharacterized protein